MSSIHTAAQRRRTCLLVSSFLVPALSLSVSVARAQQVAQVLPPIEIDSPGEQNRTRAKPVADEGSGIRRVAPTLPQRRNVGVAPSGNPDGTQTSNTPAVRQFSGIVGTSATVITAEEIARSPAQT